MGGDGGGGGGNAGHAGRASATLLEDGYHDNHTCAICNTGAERTPATLAVAAAAGDDGGGDDGGGDDGVLQMCDTSLVDDSGASGGAGNAGRAPTSVQEDDNHDKLTCAICNAGAEPAAAGDDSGSGGGRNGLVRVQSQAPTLVPCPALKAIDGLSHYNKRHTSSFERAYRKGFIFDKPG